MDNLLDTRFADATSRIKAYTFNPGRNVAVVYRLGFWPGRVGEGLEPAGAATREVTL